MSVRSCTRALLVAALLLGTSAASADPTPQEKAAAAADGKKALAAAGAKRFRVAAALYESAYQHAPEPRWLYGAASAWARADEPVRAANAYARYLREASAKAASRDKATKELAAVAAKVGALSLRADGASALTLDGAALPSPLPPVVYASAGAHEVGARFGERAVSQTVTLESGRTAEVTLTAPPEPKAEEAPAVAEVPAAAAGDAPKKEAGRKPLPPAVFYVGAGLTVVAGGLALASAIDTSSQKSAFDNERSQANLDLGREKQTRTNILLGVTGGLAVVTGVTALVLVDWKGKPKDVQVGAGPGSVVLSGTF
ncbi:MAG: hypothetical protein JWP97_6748 [Labilithrix sp.]|nr:hypothetical protein [Labilithrix sp.]